MRGTFAELSFQLDDSQLGNKLAHVDVQWQLSTKGERESPRSLYTNERGAGRVIDLNTKN